MNPVHSTAIDPARLSSRQSYGTAKPTPVAVSSSNAPALALLAIDAGKVVPPHCTRSGLRLLTVRSVEPSRGVDSEIETSPVPDIPERMK